MPIILLVVVSMCSTLWNYTIGKSLTDSFDEQNNEASGLVLIATIIVWIIDGPISITASILISSFNIAHAMNTCFFSENENESFLDDEEDRD